MNKFKTAVLACLAMTAFPAAAARACSVCYGDPESPMTKGAVAGVVVMIGIIGSVLAGIAGTGLYWLHRSRRLDLHANDVEDHTKDDTEDKADPGSDHANSK